MRVETAAFLIFLVIAAGFLGLVYVETHQEPACDCLGIYKDGYDQGFDDGWRMGANRVSFPYNITTSNTPPWVENATIINWWNDTEPWVV